MKLQFKHQKFQAEAAKAVVDVFAGQPYLTATYMMDRGNGTYQLGIDGDKNFTGWSNQKLVPELSDPVILKHIQEIQKNNQIAPSPKLEGRFNLTIEMETGVGKTYTYIKTMYELNKHYGWSKFIVVVPSVAIREGVYKSFQMTQEHFAEEYGKKVRFFVYNSAQLTEIDRFASDSSINVMIINSQAFNARGKDARRIYMKLDEFRSRRPIDMIAKTNPILIIDEPQSVEGKQTRERLKEFCPLFTLRYSATHKSDSIYNMIYRLDAMEAYNKRLVKKIAVKGITETGSTATESYVYLESINLSKKDPTATIQFDMKGASDIRKVSRTVGIGFNLYDHSGHMEEYKNNFVVKHIDGRDDSIEFLNGIKLYAGDVIGVFRFVKRSSLTFSVSASCSTRASRCCPCSSLTRLPSTGCTMQPVSRVTASTQKCLRRNTPILSRTSSLSSVRTNTSSIWNPSILPPPTQVTSPWTRKAR